MTDKELVKLYKQLYLEYKNYSDLLVDELNEVVPMAFTYGWKSSRFDGGVAARKKIEELELEIDHGILDEITKISQEQGLYE